MKTAAGFRKNNGIGEWRNKDGWLHRKNGPARIHPNGTKEWYLNGLLHRTMGPAVTTSTGVMEYWYEGMLHRVDGPAIIYPEGDFAWFIDDNELTAEIEIWLFENKITYPFSESDLILFQMRWL